MTQLHFTLHQKTTYNNNSIPKKERKAKIKYAQDLHVENLKKKIAERN